jgi:ribosome maturation protein Sdo1
MDQVVIEGILLVEVKYLAMAVIPPMRYKSVLAEVQDLERDKVKVEVLALVQLRYHPNL